MHRHLTTLAVALLLGTAASSTRAVAQTDSVWSGVYTAAQAERGRQAYQRHCSYCHHDDLLGGEDLEVVPPALVSAEFRERFGGKSVGRLFRVISETMPWRRQSLTPEIYRDIVSYVLKENGFPAGMQELPADQAALDRIAITMTPPK